ncbi:MAG TPA: hypothetical protein VM324_07830 [Egibacteraceae bacterium]|nr:hypothetical protein [Egibacteraceae bacterium]
MITTSDTTSRTRPPAATAVGWLAVAGVVGATIMSLAHLDVAVPFVEVGRVVLPVAIGLAVGAVLYAVVAYGAFTQASWAWPVALVVNGIALAATAGPPFRGPFELVPIAVSLVAIGVLVSSAGRAALRSRR